MKGIATSSKQVNVHKCRYRHEIDPDYKKKEEVLVGKNNKDNSKDRNKNKCHDIGITLTA